MSYSLTLPNAQGTAGSVLTNNGSDGLSWNQISTTNTRSDVIGICPNTTDITWACLADKTRGRQWQIGQQPRVNLFDFWLIRWPILVLRTHTPGWDSS